MYGSLRKSGIVAGLFLVCLGTGRQSAEAQFVGRGFFSPVDAISSRVFAAADVVRAQSEAAVNYQAAREIRARAVRLEIQNSVERVRAYWDRKSIGEAEILRRRVSFLDAAKTRNAKTWERLADHPELNGPAIINGSAQNFLLHRLSSSVLAFEYSTDHSDINAEAISRLHIDDDLLSHLNLRQKLTNGQMLVFRANDGTPLDVDWWPYALRGDEFAELRLEFLKERQLAIAEARDGRISPASLTTLYEAFMDLSDEFHLVFNRDRRLSEGVVSWTQYKQADVFLKSLFGEISRLQSTGDIASLDVGQELSPDGEGTNLLHMLTFMSRHGLDFAPAKPNDEPAYHELFHMLRDLYVNVVDEDESLIPSKPLPPAPETITERNAREANQPSPVIVP